MRPPVLTLHSSPAKKMQYYARKRKEDLISKLPDEILGSIISFLSMREAAKTALLSRQWKNLWKKTIMFAPRLLFYNKDVHGFSLQRSECEKYMNEVNEIMKLHEAPTLEELAIAFTQPLHERYCDKNVTKWLKFAAKKNVQKLNLSVYCRKYNSYNRRLYWPRLRECCLSKLNVDDQDIDCLISNSPFLERLCVIDSFVAKDLIVSKAPNLKYLEIRGGATMRSLNIISAPNLNHLILCHHRYRVCHRFVSVRLCAPNLVRLRFCGVVESQSPMVFVDFPPPALYHVSLGLKNSVPTGGGSRRLKFLCFKELLGQFPQVNRLRLDLGTEVFEDIVERNDMNQQFHQLTNLEHLELSIDCPGFIEKSFLWLCPLVNAAPYLHTLSIKLSYDESSTKRVSFYSPRLIDFEWKDEDILSKVKANIRHSHKYLKVVELFGFTGFRSQLEFILYLLGIATSLEKLIIDVRIPWHYWEDDILMFCDQNSITAKSLACAQRLKTQIHHEVDVIVI